MTFDPQGQTWPLRSTLTFEIKIKLWTPVKRKPKLISLKMSGSLLKNATPQLLILTFDLIAHIIKFDDIQGSAPMAELSALLMDK